MDIMFIYQNFIADLPDDLEEFIHNFTYYFPHIYDTKVMAECLGLFARTDLEFMSKKCFSDNRWKNYIQFDMDVHCGFKKYVDNQVLHEAGYDSYITGVCFGNLVK